MADLSIRKKNSRSRERAACGVPQAHSPVTVAESRVAPGSTREVSPQPKAGERRGAGRGPASRVRLPRCNKGPCTHLSGCLLPALEKLVSKKGLWDN